MDFQFDGAASGGWSIAGTIWPENPIVVLPHWALSAVDMFLMCRSAGGMAGSARFAAGGVGDQPAALTDAFTLLEGWITDAGPA